MPELRLRWYPKQAELRRLVNESLHVHIGYGGARGGGKSQGGRNVIIDRALRYPGTRHLILRRTFKELWGNHISRLFEQHPFLRKYYNTQTKELRIPTGQGSPDSVIVFGYAEHKADIYAFQGQEFATILVEEATHFTEEELKFLETCCRYVGPLNLVAKMVYTTNPGNRGHDYIKRLFITKDYRENEDPAQYAYLHAYGWENVGWGIKQLEQVGVSIRQYYQEWTDDQRFQFFIKHTDYGRVLNALPETERLQHLLGDWETFAGQFFGEFRRDLHVLKPFGLRPHWSRFTAADWGFNAPACNLWFALTDDEWWETKQPNGKLIKIPPRSVIVYKEFYERKVPTDKLGRRWVERSAGETLKYKMLDPSCWDASRGPSIAEELSHVGWQCQAAENDRKSGWSRVRQYLAWHREKSGEMTQWPHLFFFDVCENLCRTLPALIHDENDIEDVDTDGEDHAADALRYGLMTRPPLSLEQLEQMDEEIAEAVMRAQHHEEQRKKRPESIWLPRAA